jgi:hypothetical protein
LADPPASGENDSEMPTGEAATNPRKPLSHPTPDTDNEGNLFNGVLAVASLFVAVLGLIIRSPGTPSVRFLSFAILLIGALVLTIFSKSQRRIKVEAILLALTAAATSVAAVQWLSVRPTPEPQIEITGPIDGGWISSHPTIKGTTTPLTDGQEIFSFNEPFTTSRLARPGGQAFPDAGPCQSAGRVFTCTKDFSGGHNRDYCQRFYLWVAIVTIQEGNYYNNVKSGTAGDSDQIFVALTANNGPQHIGAAIDRIEVQRDPPRGKAC